MMSSPAELVLEFLEACRNEHPKVPDIDGCTDLQHRFFQDNAASEIEELRDAYACRDLPEIAKEACDAIYFLIHYLLRLGIDFDAAFAEVHRSNMTKFDPVTGDVYRDENGRITKGPYFMPANMERVLEEQRARTSSPF
jgi:predicted HAD superfamily Cof-like phosphohydrolase